MKQNSGTASVSLDVIATPSGWKRVRGVRRGLAVFYRFAAVLLFPHVITRPNSLPLASMPPSTPTSPALGRGHDGAVSLPAPDALNAGSVPVGSKSMSPKSPPWCAGHVGGGVFVGDDISVSHRNRSRVDVDRREVPAVRRAEDVADACPTLKMYMGAVESGSEMLVTVALASLSSKVADHVSYVRTDERAFGVGQATNLISKSDQRSAHLRGVLVAKHAVGLRFVGDAKGFGDVHPSTYTTERHA